MCTRNSILFEENPTSIASQEEPSQTVQRSSSKHDTNTPHRSGTNGIADRAVRRVEGRATVSVQSGPPDELVGLCDGMLVLLAQRPCQHGRGQDGTRERLLESREKILAVRSMDWNNTFVGSRKSHTSPLYYTTRHDLPRRMAQAIEGTEKQNEKSSTMHPQIQKTSR